MDTREKRKLLHATTDDELPQIDASNTADVLNKLWPAMRAYARTLLHGNSHAVDEVLQQSFIHIWEREKDLPGIENLRAWALRIVYFKSLSFRRDNARNLLVGLPPEMAEKLMSIDDNAREADQKNVLVLQECVAQLPKSDRKILDLYYENNLTFQEVGQIIEKNDAAVRQHVSRLRRILRQCVKKKLKHN